MVFNRKRKDNRSPSFILDDSPKRTKVQAQRKFAQGSNVNSPVLTPVKEIECQERTMPEPVELIPMKRPNTEDFLTFLCFRGTPVLPPGLNFFNSASMVDSRPRSADSPSTSPKNGLIFPSAISKTQGERPFIAFGVRKRADPIVVSRHMDKKRRHALALQALRRKYQEQKMAKIRAITISKLSEKVQTNKTVVRTTRSITKSDHTVTKKNMASKTKITVVSTKRVKVTTRRTSTLKQARGKVNVKVNKKKQKMCLRSYRGRFVQRELVNKPVKKRAVKKSKHDKDEDAEVDEEEMEEEEEEFSSDDDEPLLKKTVKTKKIINKKPEKSYRLTRSNQILTRRLPKAQPRILVRGTAANLKSPPNSPRLRSQLKRKLKVVKQEVVKTAPLKKKHLITKKIDLKRKVLRGGKIREVEIKKTITNDNKTSEEKTEEKRITRDAQRKINDEDDKKITKVEEGKKKITKKVTRVEIKVTKTQDAKKKVQQVKNLKNKQLVKKALSTERKSKEESNSESSDEEEGSEEKKTLPVKNKKTVNEDKDDDEKNKVATRSENEKKIVKNKKSLSDINKSIEERAVKSKVEEKKKGKKSIDADEGKEDEKKKGKKSIDVDEGKEEEKKKGKKSINADEGKEDEKKKGKKSINADEGKEDEKKKGKKSIDADEGKEDEKKKGKKSINSDEGKEDEKKKGKKSIDVDEGKEDEEKKGKKSIDADEGKDDEKKKVTAKSKKGGVDKEEINKVSAKGKKVVKDEEIDEKKIITPKVKKGGEDEIDGNNKVASKGKKVINDTDEKKKAGVKGKKGSEEGSEENNKVASKGKKIINEDEAEENKKVGVKGKKGSEYGIDENTKLASKGKKIMNEDETEEKKKLGVKGKKGNEDGIDENIKVASKGKKVIDQDETGEKKKAAVKGKKGSDDEDENNKVVAKDKKAIDAEGTNEKKKTAAGNKVTGKGKKAINAEEADEKKAAVKSKKGSEDEDENNEVVKDKKEIETDEKKKTAMKGKKGSKNDEVENNKAAAKGKKAISTEEPEEKNKNTKVDDDIQKKKIAVKNKKTLVDDSDDEIETNKVTTRSKHDDSEKKSTSEVITKSKIDEVKISSEITTKSKNDENRKKNTADVSAKSKTDENEKKNTSEVPTKSKNENIEKNTSEVITRSNNEDNEKLNTSEVTTRSKSEETEKKNTNDKKVIAAKSSDIAKSKKTTEVEEESTKKKIVAKNKHLGAKQKLQTKGKKNKFVEESEPLKEVEVEETRRTSRRSIQVASESESTKIKNANKQNNQEEEEDEEINKSSEDLSINISVDTKKTKKKVETKKIIKSQKMIEMDDSEEETKKIIKSQKKIDSEENQLKKNIEDKPKVTDAKFEDKPKNIDNPENQSKKIKLNEEIASKIEETLPKQDIEDQAKSSETLVSMKNIEDETNKEDESSKVAIENPTYSLYEDINTCDAEILVNQAEKNGLLSVEEKDEIEDKSNEINNRVIGIKKMKTYSNNRLKRNSAKTDQEILEENAKSEEKPTETKDKEIVEKEVAKINDESLKSIELKEEFLKNVESEVSSPTIRDSLEEDGSPKTSKFYVDLKKASDFTLKIDHSEKNFEIENRLAAMFGGSDTEHDSDDEDTALKICSDEDNDDYEDKRRTSVDMNKEVAKAKVEAGSISLLGNICILQDKTIRSKDSEVGDATCLNEREQKADETSIKLESPQKSSNMFGIMSHLKKMEEFSSLLTHKQTDSQNTGYRLSSNIEKTKANIVSTSPENVSGLPSRVNPSVIASNFQNIVTSAGAFSNQEDADRHKLNTNLKNTSESPSNFHSSLIFNNTSISLSTKKSRDEERLHINPMYNFQMMKNETQPLQLKNTGIASSKNKNDEALKKNSDNEDLLLTKVHTYTSPRNKVLSPPINIKNVQVTSPMKQIENINTSLLNKKDISVTITKVDCGASPTKKIDCESVNAASINKRNVDVSPVKPIAIDASLMKKIDTPPIKNIVSYSSSVKSVSSSEVNTVKKQIVGSSPSPPAAIQGFNAYPYAVKNIDPQTKKVGADALLLKPKVEASAIKILEDSILKKVSNSAVEIEVAKIAPGYLKKPFDEGLKLNLEEVTKPNVDNLTKSLAKSAEDMSSKLNTRDEDKKTFAAVLKNSTDTENLKKSLTKSEDISNRIEIQRVDSVGDTKVPNVEESEVSKKSIPGDSKEDTKTKEEIESSRMDAMISEMAKQMAAQDAQTCPRVPLQKQKKLPKKTKPVQDLPKRPSRKTKEAAAVYMEILGHKLENEDLDDVSIDSFPELPNVKKMEQRENELKASLLQKKKEKKSEKAVSDSEESIHAQPPKESEVKVVKKREKKKVAATSDSDESYMVDIKTPPEKMTRQTRKTSPKLYKSFSDTDSESDLIPIKQVIVKRKSDTDNSEKKNKKARIEEDDSAKQNKKEEIGEGKSKLQNEAKRKSNLEEERLEESGKTKDESNTQGEESLGSMKNKNKSVLTEEESVERESKKKKLTNDEHSTKNINKGNVRKLCASYSEDESKNESSLQKSNTSKGKKDTKLNKNAKLEQQEGSDDSDDEVLEKILKKRTKKKAKLSEEGSSVESDSEVLLKKGKKLPAKKKKKPRLDDDHASFDESDEEPLVKLKKRPSEEMGKQKRECTKKPQNYLPQFSSSEDEEKYFHGFVKAESPPKPPKIMKIVKRDDPVDLLSTKDLGRRYGKEKVNMSNEQIEKWLNDSALAGMSLIKKENDEMLKFGEKIPTETSLETLLVINTDSLKNSILPSTSSAKIENKEKLLSSPSVTPEKYANISPLRPFPKTIFRKEKNEPSKNINAFSVCNESSVYAFEADTEDLINTPFRRPNRRPSSTATSKSEDDLGIGKDHDQKLSKFRHPNLMCSNKSGGKDASSLNISTDESNNSGSLTQKSGVKSLEKTNKPLAASTPMCPPTQTTLQKAKECRSSARSCSKSLDRASDAASEEFKYKIPSSPSASSSSSAKLYKRNIKKNKMSENYTPVNVTEFPTPSDNVSRIVEAPVFHPTDKEFVDPLEYIEKIRARAEKFGICRIVPPANFKPECKVLDEMRFTAYNQYVHKMMHRWGPNFREFVAIRKYLATQSISLKHPPWIGGMEIDLPRLYQTVQTLGGLREVIEKKKWPKVSELMKIPKSAQDRVTKLDDIYCKYLLPYDTLSPDERDKLFDSVETDWAKRESKSMLKVQQSEAAEVEEVKSEEEESEDEDEMDIECIMKGRSMALNTFYRIARNSMAMWFKNSEPDAQEVEEEFWKHVTTKKYHICVHSGSIDSGNWGYGFAVSKNSPFARHAWNLKVLTNNSGSLLRSMGPVMGLTVPTLHVGMVFSGCCWYRDPHALPWIEYLHTGGNKIWYGIPDSMSEKFHSTLLNLVPNYCLNKSIWLPSDTVMLPPELLVDNGVSLTRTVQKPGEFVVIFPKAFTSNICTGYVVSESVFFAPPHWLNNAEVVFDELRDSCEPSMFSYERLLLSVANDSRSDVNVLKQIVPAVWKLCEREKQQRAEIKGLGVVEEERLPIPDNKKKKKMHESEIEYACEDCRRNLFCSMVFDSQENGIYCLEHATSHLKTKTIEAEKCRLMFTYDVPELDVLVKNLNATIEAKMLKKSAGSRQYSLPTMVSLVH